MARCKATKLDRIWNRACEYPSSIAPLEAGDLALRDMLRAHGLICNGGVFHVFNMLSDQEIRHARSGYRFYGLHEVVGLLDRAEELVTKNRELDNHEADFDSEYARYVPNDSVLIERFEKHYAAKPSDFAPLAS